MARYLPNFKTLALLTSIIVIYHFIITNIGIVETDPARYVITRSLWPRTGMARVGMDSTKGNVPWNKVVDLLSRLRHSKVTFSAADLDLINVTISALQDTFLATTTDTLLKEVTTRQAQRSTPRQTRRKAVAAQVVCPEIYKGSTYGLPYFDTGWVLQNCSDVPPFEEVLTLLFNFIDLSENMRDMFDWVIEPAMSLYRNVSIFAAISEKQRQGFTDQPLSNGSLTFVVFSQDTRKPGSVWNSLIQKSRTPYVFIGRDVIYFDNDTRLERLVREISETEAGVAAGATRSRKGYWNLSCLQSVVKNYTLVYTSGYHKSLHSCVFCGHTHAPFVMEKTFAEKIPFPENSESTQTTFSNFFLQVTSARERIVVCPDVMFHSTMLTHESEKKIWEPVAKQWTITNIHLETSERIIFSCDEVNIKCGLSYLRKGLAVPPCCLQQLATMVKHFHKTCDEHGIISEMKEGTLLGAVKFNAVLPWERDADVGFLTANYSVLLGLKNAFALQGYQLSKSYEPWCCVDGRYAGGIFYLSKRGTFWRVEIYGDHRLNSESLTDNGRPRTRVLFDGQWVPTPRNPGLYSRNHYGDEIFQHSQHWLVMGRKSGWDEYTLKRFTQCPAPGHHSCLDQYKPDGNIQFRVPIL